MKLEDVNTFNITFKTTNQVYQFMMDWVRSYPNDIDIISDSIIRDTNQLYKKDDMFKKLVSNVKKVNKIKDEYAMKHNHKYLDDATD